MFHSTKRYGYTHLRAPALVAAAVVGCLCGPTVHACAGHYTQTAQTGGQMNVNGQPTDYMAGSGGYGAASSGWGAANINCSGDITTTFWWVPDGDGDQPPDQVVIAETCSAGWTGFSYEGTTGSADNGLGFQQVLDPYGGGGSSQGTRYKIVPGTQTLQVTASPSASVFAFQGTYGISVWYTVTASPLEVDLSGGIGQGNAKQYLPGQQAGAGLNPGGLQVDPNSYQWTVSGCSPFLDYTIAQDDSSATFTAYAPQTTFTFYFAKDGQATVTCDAHLNVPDAAMPQGGLSVTVVRHCQVDPLTGTPTLSIGHSQIITDGTDLLFALSSLPDPTPYGCTWTASETEPDAFSEMGHGTWAYLQLWTPNRTVKYADGTSQKLSGNGTTGLDLQFPYGPGTPADGTHLTLGDRPATGLSADMVQATASDSFVTYIMYRPPGDGSKYVPLFSWSWTWVGTASRPTVGDRWAATDGGSALGPTTQYPAHPVWTMLQQLHWVAGP